MTSLAFSSTSANTTSTFASERAHVTAFPSRRARIAGRCVSGVGVTFLAMDACFKLFMVDEAVKSTTDLGYSVQTMFGIGVLQAILLVLYLVPRTAVLGAVLWTGYLGGAIATHVRVDNPLFSHVLFPVYVAGFLWLGLWLRDLRVRNMSRI